MLVAGADVSGDEKKGQARYVAFIVGREEDINSQHNYLGIKEIHMIRLDHMERKQVIEGLDFRRYNLKAWCFYVDRQQTVDTISNHPKLHPKNRRREKIQKSFDSHFLYQFREDLENLTFKHSVSLNDLSVDCDNDMSLTVKNWRMKRSSMGKAFQLADAVAWCNEHEQKLQGVEEVSLRDAIYKAMSKDLLR